MTKMTKKQKAIKKVTDADPHSQTLDAALGILPATSKQPDPDWLHCLHFRGTSSVFTVRPIYFKNPARAIPCAVCNECALRILTPDTVCVGVGSSPFDDDQIRQFDELKIQKRSAMMSGKDGHVFHVR
jgi:hypothetical protein